VPATYGEAFGLYVLEALACGVPVVEPDHAGLGEITRLTGGGELTPANDIPALAAALENLLLQPEKCRQLASAGRENVLAYFSAERMAREFAELCRSVAEGAAAPH
jgi:glycosyltransferase involved in cell wall biosynthesis